MSDIGRAPSGSVPIKTEVVSSGKANERQFLSSSLNRAVTVVFVLTGTASAAVSQLNAMSADVIRKPTEIRNVVDYPKTEDEYAPMQEKEPYRGIKVERDIRYGPAERNLLDVFASVTDSSAQPVLIFVHGGAFAAGDKHAAGSPFYDNVALWAARHGFIGINMTYRLAPQSRWPAGAEDIALAVKWVTNNIGSRGGDGSRIYLVGHSAGATHVASYVAHPEYYRTEDGGIRGAIMLSGLYDPTASALRAPERAYFGDDPGRYAERSSIVGLVVAKIPLMIVTAEFDAPVFLRQFDLLKDAACQGPNGCIRSVVLLGHNHMSEVYSINTADTRLTDQILDFVNKDK
ncbi:alpha/beta hydrolase [Bradyrhizobium sp.]|uniref:alpha/beta hydrolase n=1 Tax=Bradyrhizobium sp. TaxID=376 RepID=UPI003C28C7EE